MKKMSGFSLLVSVVCAASVNASIALKHVHAEDLRVMVDFVNQHQKVIETLESIDFKNTTVYFDGGCKAVFKHEKASKLAIKPPPPVLKFESSDCALTYKAKPSDS